MKNQNHLSAVDSSIVVSLDELINGMNESFNRQGCALLAGGCLTQINSLIGNPQNFQVFKHHGAHEW